MAAEEVYERGSKTIHVPPCDHKPCRDNLLQVVDQLRHAGVECQHKYTPLGLYVDSFQKCVKSYPYTIMHVCPLFYKKLSQALDMSLLLKEFGGKMMCVRTNQSEYSSCSKDDDVTCETYFAHFFQSDVSSESSIADFVSEVTNVVQVYTNRATRTCDNPSYNVDHPTVIVDLNIEDNYSIVEDTPNDNKTVESQDQIQLRGAAGRQTRQAMEPLSDIFGQIQGQEVFARADWIQAEHGKFVSITAVSSVREWICCFDPAKDDTDTKTRQTTVHYVLTQIIPELYKSKQALALAHIAVSGQAVLQTHATIMLELMLLEGHIMRSRDHLVTIEHMLTEYLDQRENSGMVTNPQEAGLLRRRLSNLLWMLSCEIAMYCQETRNPKQSKPFVRLDSIMNKGKVTKASNKNRNTDVSQKSAQQLMDVVSEFCKLSVEEDPYPRARKLLDRSPVKQMAVVYAHLKEIFSTMKSQWLVHLKEYVNCKKPPPPECLSMIVLGLTLFLCHGMRNASDRNIQELAAAVVDVLEAASSKDVHHEVNWMQVMLIFDKTPFIRQRIIRYFKTRKIYPSDIEELLLTEIKRLLRPFFIADTRKCGVTQRGNWRTACGTFSGSPVIVLFHAPQEQDHESKNETQFINFVDTMHTNQIKTLLKLQHDRIISMVAYQDSCIPQFYVLEDYMANNLQLALKNRNDNRRYFEYQTLMRFLCCVIEALEYCHSRNIVHRNLTADSLFVVAEYTVKLGGFNLAIDMNTHKELTVVSGSSQIPTRWSAPESLSRLQYSKASDVYMFGHLVYEVLTHGALPYSHTSLPDMKFFEQVTSNNIHLCHEKCMQKGEYIEMCRFVAFDPGDRPDASTVKETMANLCKNVCREYKPRFPILSEDPTGHERQPSTGCTKGSPEYESHVEQLYVRPFSISVVGNLMQCKLGDGYLFREEVKRKMTQYMLDHLNSAYRGVIPSCLNIHRDGEEHLTFEYYIPSLQVLNILHYVSPPDVYLTAILKVAETLDKLHNASFILGDLSTSNVYVEIDNGINKVHIVSWAYLNYTQTFSDRAQQQHLSKDRSVLTRAAPEVIESGLYSPASDVYCFGKLLKDISTSVSRSFNHYSNQGISQKLSQPWNQCFELLNGIAAQCMQANRCKRLPLMNVIEQIQNIIARTRPSIESHSGSSYDLRFHSNFFSHTSHRDHSQSSSTDYDGSLGGCSVDSETSVKRRFYSDNDDEVAPKYLYEKHHSRDSGMQSSCGSHVSIKHGEHTPRDCTSIHWLGSGADDDDIYTDAISSPALVNSHYTNVPKPIRIADDTGPDYSEPANIPLGYKYVLKRTHINNHRQQHQRKTPKEASEESIYVDIESVLEQMSEDRNGGKVVQTSVGKKANVPACNSRPLPGTGRESSNEGSCYALSDSSDSYQCIQDITLLTDSDDTNSGYQRISFGTSDDESEIYV